MQQTYCGKSCDLCEYKSMLSCPGCHEGPGRKAFGDCMIASCCRQKSLNSCTICSAEETCMKYRMRMDAALKRKLSEQVKKEQIMELNRTASSIGKNIWWLFWLLIINAAGNVFLEFSLYLPRLSGLGTLLRDASTIISGIILLNLMAHSDHFKSAGWCTILSGVGNLLGMWLGFLLMLPAVVLACVGAYHEIQGYAQITHFSDPGLSGGWKKLWIGYLVLAGAVVLVVVLVYVLPVAGVTLLQGLAYGRILAYLAKQILLYYTAKVFRNHRPVNV